jgi:hypothetical protein
MSASNESGSNELAEEFSDERKRKTLIGGIILVIGILSIIAVAYFFITTSASM